MRSTRAKKWLIMLAALLMLLSTIVFIPGLIYALPFLVAAILYDKSRVGFWLSLVMAAPVILAVTAQFSLRMYLLIFHGGEAPGGDGSPMAFLFGMLLETPFYLLMIGLAIAWVRDFRANRAVSSDDGLAEEPI